jgi:predicted CoA-binding protein
MEHGAIERLQVDRRPVVDANQILKAAKSVLVIDWPSEDVPESLVRAGKQVVVRGGPGPADYSVWEWGDGHLVKRPLGRAPDSVDLVYAHRPLSELPDIVNQARSLGATAVWTQSGLSADDCKDPRGCWVAESDLESARKLVEAAGMVYFSSPYIGGVPDGRM